MLSPVDQGRSEELGEAGGRHPSWRSRLHAHLSLTDGGAYDNLGLEPIDDFSTIIVSDAGAPFGTEETASTLWPQQAMRALDIATDQARALAQAAAVCAMRGRKPARRLQRHRFQSGRLPGDPDAQADLRLRRLARMRTRLDRSRTRSRGALINWGWLMMDVAMRSYVTKQVSSAVQPAAAEISAWLIGVESQDA